MKNVAIAATSPAPNEAVANAVLGKVVEPKTRWNVGSLVGSIIGEITAAAVILITASKIKVYTPALAADGISPLAAATQTGLVKITPIETTGRSRSLEFAYADGAAFVDGVTPGTDVLDSDGNLPAEFNPLFVKSLPSFTLQGLISAMMPTLEDEAFLLANPDWFLAIDQFTGEVFFELEAAGFKTAIDSTFDFSSLYLEFDLTADVDPVEATGPVWG